MQLKPNNQAEYYRRHNPIWAELAAMLKVYGVSNYSIFLDRRTDQLFGYAEVESEEMWAEIANTEICRRWWIYMRDLMETNRDNSPASIPLIEVFHLD
jgi:L-rhamnose mutarotase